MAEDVKLDIADIIRLGQECLDNANVSGLSASAQQVALGVYLGRALDALRSLHPAPSRESVLEEAAKAGYDACRKSVYAVCEDISEEADRIRVTAAVGSAAQEQHAKGYHAGTRVVAKSIARTFGSLGYEDDNLIAAIRALAPTAQEEA